MSKEIEQNEHYTGKIAMSLDPSLVVKELDTGKDGLITKEAVRKQTSDPQEEIDQMKQTAKDEGAELDADQLALIKELETAAKVKQQEDDERYPMLKAIDKRAQDRIGNHADITQFKETVLLSNEELITELPVVAFEGLVTAPSDMKVGNGTLMLSKLTRFDGSSVHRLHFYIDDKDSTFKATQRFKTADLPNAKAEAEAEQFVMANHGLTGTFASAFVENNLVHIHSEVEETSRLAQRLIGSVAKSPGCCKTTCIPCCNMCCYIACCKWCPNCCDFCPDCCACCKLHPYYIHWDMDVQSQSATERLAQLLSEPWELEKEGMAVKMPFNKMEREIPDGIETSAGVVKTTHTIHLTMRNSATNKVEAGKAIVAPEASISEIIKFESLMQSVSAQGSYKASENETTSHVQSWKTNGYTRSVPLFGGGGFFMAPSSSGAPPQFDLKGIFPFLA